MKKFTYPLLAIIIASVAFLSSCDEDKPEPIVPVAGVANDVWPEHSHSKAGGFALRCVR